MLSTHTGVTHQLSYYTVMQHIFTRKDLQIGGLDVQAGEITYIIDGYKGHGYGKSTEEELGWC